MFITSGIHFSFILSIYVIIVLFVFRIGSFTQINMDYFTVLIIIYAAL